MICNLAISQDSHGSRFYVDSIYSNHLSEYRRHNIYLPENYNAENKYPIVYATDGKEIKDNFIKTLLDSLITNKIIKPIIYVESFPNRKIVDSIDFGNGEIEYLELRNYEYVEAFSNSSEKPDLKNRFKNHMLYFKEELIPYVETKLKMNNNKRVFYGASNGAGFGINFINKYPNMVENFICFSPIGTNIDNLEWEAEKTYPTLYLEYGDNEPEYFKKEAEKIKENYNASVEFYIFNGEHENQYWNEQLKNVLVKIFKF